MKQYLDLVKHVLANGHLKQDRTGTGTLSVFGYQMRFNLQEGFPLVTTKKLHTKSIIHELLWFLAGDTNIKYLNDNGVHIWKEWRRPYTLDREFVKIPKAPSKTFAEYKGNYSTRGLNATKDSVEDKLRDTWVKMMRRCYDTSHHRYPIYGAKGAFVVKEWHDVTTFIKDVKHIPHWYYKTKDWSNFQLDKDYYGTNYYSKDTCVWLHNCENNPQKGVIITTPEGEELVFPSISDASNGTCLSRSSIHRFLTEGLPKILKGKNKTLKGWGFKTAKGEDFVIRRKLMAEGDLGPVYGSQWRSWTTPDGQHIDQIASVVEQIKNSPDSRRLIVSAWNVGELDAMALPPCHMMFQFYVCDGKLSCQLYQRSADIGLGVPFNIASYALLVHMMAQQCDLEVGEFVWTGGDCHIYTNHVEQLKIQVERNPFELPKLIINNKPASIFNYKFEDFEIVDYNSHPHIKMDVAV